MIDDEKCTAMACGKSRSLFRPLGLWMCSLTVHDQSGRAMVCQHQVPALKGASCYRRQLCWRLPSTPSNNVVTHGIYWRQIWRVAGRESGNPELLGSPRTSPEVPQTSPEVPQTSPEVFRRLPPEVLSLWNFTAIQGFPGSFPNFPGSFPDFPGSFPDFPGGQPFLWEAWHPLLTRKNFPWI